MASPLFIVLKFCRKSSINISIDNHNCNRFIHIRPISQQRLCSVYNPDHIWDRACSCHLVTLVKHWSPNLRPDCWIIATWQLHALTIQSTHYVTNNCIYFQSHMLDATNSIAIHLMTMKDWFFSRHRPLAIRHFFLLAVVISGGCAMTSIPRASEICHIEIPSQFIYTFGHSITLPLSQYFNDNINLCEAARPSSPNIAHSTWMHGTLWNAI